MSLGIVLLTLSLSCGDDDPPTGGNGIAADSIVQISDEGSHPTVSPDGAFVAYKTSSGIYKAPVGGGSTVKIFGYGLEPDWSWVHDLILVRAGNVTIFDPATGDTTKTLTVAYDDGPCWSPLGTEIAAQDDGILLISYPGGVTSTVPCADTLDGGCEGEWPSWSPDGQWLAFEDGLEILKIPRAGGIATPVVYDLWDVSYPAWSPDGDWIAFLMEDSTHQFAHIWVSDSRGKNLGLYRMTDGEYIDYAPAWSPDSKQIFFSRRRVDSSFHYTPLGIWRVSFEGE
jgi:Tol biopolymer transport system component